MHLYTVALRGSTSDAHVSLSRNDSVVVGRGDEAGLVVPDPRVSKVHATLSVDADGTFEVVDSSTNGCFIDGSRIPKDTATRVGDSAVIMIAQDPTDGFRGTISLVVTATGPHGRPWVLQTEKGHRALPLSPSQSPLLLGRGDAGGDRRVSRKQVTLTKKRQVDEWHVKVIGQSASAMRRASDQSFVPLPAGTEASLRLGDTLFLVGPASEHAFRVVAQHGKDAAQSGSVDAPAAASAPEEPPAAAGTAPERSKRARPSEEPDRAEAAPPGAGGEEQAETAASLPPVKRARRGKVKRKATKRGGRRMAEEEEEEEEAAATEGREQQQREKLVEEEEGGEEGEGREARAGGGDLQEQLLPWLEDALRGRDRGGRRGGVLCGTETDEPREKPLKPLCWGDWLTLGIMTVPFPRGDLVGTTMPRFGGKADAPEDAPSLQHCSLPDRARDQAENKNSALRRIYYRERGWTGQPAGRRWPHAVGPGFNFGVARGGWPQAGAAEQGGFQFGGGRPQAGAAGQPLEVESSSSSEEGSDSGGSDDSGETREERDSMMAAMAVADSYDDADWDPAEHEAAKRRKEKQRRQRRQRAKSAALGLGGGKGGAGAAAKGQGEGQGKGNGRRRPRGTRMVRTKSEIGQFQGGKVEMGTCQELTVFYATRERETGNLVPRQEMDRKRDRFPVLITTRDSIPQSLKRLMSAGMARVRCEMRPTPPLHWTRQSHPFLGRSVRDAARTVFMAHARHALVQRARYERDRRVAANPEAAHRLPRTLSRLQSFLDATGPEAATAELEGGQSAAAAATKAVRQDSLTQSTLQFMGDDALRQLSHSVRGEPGFATVPYSMLYRILSFLPAEETGLSHKAGGVRMDLTVELSARALFSLPEPALDEGRDLLERGEVDMLNRLMFDQAEAGDALNLDWEAVAAARADPAGRVPSVDDTTWPAGVLHAIANAVAPTASRVTYGRGGWHGSARGRKKKGPKRAGGGKGTYEESESEESEVEAGRADGLPVVPWARPRRAWPRAERWWEGQAHREADATGGLNPQHWMLTQGMEGSVARVVSMLSLSGSEGSVRPIPFAFGPQFGPWHPFDVSALDPAEEAENARALEAAENAKAVAKAAGKEEGGVEEEEEEEEGDKGGGAGAAAALPVDEERESGEDTGDPFDLFHLLEAARPRPDAPEVPTPEDMKSSLMPFQRRCLAWMLARESTLFPAASGMNVAPASEEDLIGEMNRRFPDRRLQGPLPRQLHPAWRPLRLPGGRVLFQNITKPGRLSPSPFSGLELAQGGVLADEMGLGKTVEALALVLAHPRPAEQVQPVPERFKHLARGITKEDLAAEREERERGGAGKRRSRRVRQKGGEQEDRWDWRPVASRTTLIVSPASIASQWEAEVAKHTTGLRLHRYRGMDLHTWAADLTQYDIVLTTYEALRRDQRAESAQYQSPLQHLEWWRIILDEAQMVCNSASAAAQVASSLPRIYSWCVSGTPISNRLRDLRGLVDFLGLVPFTSSAVWNKCVVEPYRRREEAGLHLMHGVVKSVMWRHRKVHVARELTLPPRRVVVPTLHFSDTERTVYERRLVECQRAVASGGAANTRVNSALLSLRQTCCHPQVASHTSADLGGGRLTLREILGRLVQQATADHEAAIRELARAELRMGRAPAVDFTDRERVETIAAAERRVHEAAQASDKPESWDVFHLELLYALWEAAEKLPSSERAALGVYHVPDRVRAAEQRMTTTQIETAKGVRAVDRVVASDRKLRDGTRARRVEADVRAAERAARREAADAEASIEPQRQIVERCLETMDRTRREAQHLLMRYTEAVQSETSATAIENCPVCLDAISDAVVLPCAHLFCRACIRNADVGYGRVCPLCRKPFRPSDMRKACNAAEEADREKAKAAEAAASAVRGQFGTKVTFVVTKVAEALREDPSTKFVVFSQWIKLLRFVGQALKAQGVGHVVLSGTRRDEAVSRFNEDEETKAMLVSMRSGGGAAGLTLTRASVAFILEPSVNISIEDQAMARVHRFGQTRNVTIYRLIMKDSVEEKVLDIQDRKRRTARGKTAASRDEKEDLQMAEIRELFGMEKEPEGEPSSG